MGLFNIFKNKSKISEPKPYKGRPKEIDLQSLLTEDEIRLLVTDIRTVANKVPGDDKAVVVATAELIQEKGALPAQGLDLCIAAVQETLGTFSAFGLAPAGNTALLDKL